MNNKIILMLPDGTEIENNSIKFIHLNGKNNTVRIKVDDVSAFEKQKGLFHHVHDDGD